MSAADVRKALVIFARHRPEMWDAIFPHGPVRRVALERAVESELNPQPLPPGPPEMLFAARRTATAIADTAVGLHLAGGDARQLVDQVIDDWCGTSPPRKIPWPRHWPPPPEPWPIDPAELVPAMQLEAAMVFQAYATDAADDSLTAPFGALADRLVEAATADAR